MGQKHSSHYRAGSNSCSGLAAETNSMEHSPCSEANSHSDSQEIPRLLLNPNVHYRVHKSSPLVPLLNQMHSVHTFLTYFRKINFNIIILSAGGGSSSSSSNVMGTFSVDNVRWLKSKCVASFCWYIKRNRDFTLRYHLQTGSGSQPASYTMDTAGGTISPRMKWPQHKGDNSLPFTVEIKSVRSCPSTLHTYSCHYP